MTHELTLYLIQGELDNTIPGWVVGWMRFAGKESPVTVKLKGDLGHGFEQGKIRFWGKATGNEEGATDFMKDVSDEQTGRTHMMMAGFEPDNSGDTFVLVWFDAADERMVLNLDPDEVVAMIVPKVKRQSMWWL
jgi:hypothetical protein